MHSSPSVHRYCLHWLWMCLATGLNSASAPFSKFALTLPARNGWVVSDSKWHGYWLSSVQVALLITPTPSLSTDPTRACLTPTKRSTCVSCSVLVWLSCAAIARYWLVLGPLLIWGYTVWCWLLVVVLGSASIGCWTDCFQRAVGSTSSRAGHIRSCNKGIIRDVYTTYY